MANQLVRPLCFLACSVGLDACGFPPPPSLQGDAGGPSDASSNDGGSQPDTAPSNGLAPYLDMTAGAVDVDLGTTATINTDDGTVQVDGSPIVVQSVTVTQTAAPTIRVFIVQVNDSSGTVLVPGGTGGFATGNAELTPLRGGCDSGNWFTTSFHGSGRGAIQFVSRSSITISGVVAANGSRQFGAGSGGGILLEAPRVQVMGPLSQTAPVATADAAWQQARHSGKTVAWMQHPPPEARAMFLPTEVREAAVALLMSRLATEPVLLQ